MTGTVTAIDPAPRGTVLRAAFAFADPGGDHRLTIEPEALMLDPAAPKPAGPRPDVARPGRSPASRSPAEGRPARHATGHAAPGEVPDAGQDPHLLRRQ